MNYLLTDSLEQSARKFPNKEAFVCLNHSVTFKELEQQTSQLASVLVSRGIKKGDRIGVYMNRCLESAIAIYGIMKAGAAYVPLDPTASTSRTLNLVEDCEIACIVTTPAQRRELKKVVEIPSSLLMIIGLSQEWQIDTIPWGHVFEQEILDFEVGLMERDLAYIIYTSGSTGLPKGIMHSHRSGLAYAQLTANLYGITADDRIGNHCVLHFDMSTLGYLTAPLVGATTIIATDAHTKMPASLALLLDKENITIWYSVPLALIQMLSSGSIERGSMPKLRWVLYGGETFPPQHIRSLMELWPNCTFSNVYGPAEVNQCTFFNFDTPPETDLPIPLGTFWKNTNGLIVNEDDIPVAIGEMGELLIRSATMMSGYWRQPELTEKSLFRQRKNSGIEEVYYRTGDLVKLDAKGKLHFHGRKDRQIKVRGYRVELEEVAEAILKFDAVFEVTVVGIKKPDENMAIISFITEKKGKVVDLGALNSFIKNILPKQALPDKNLVIEALPRTGGGKINNRQLQAEALKTYQ
ncbi:amino acid adenylation domain-containing protein [Roseivirga sp.]|uniref:amino acid adenylation domain-containing protein n=1 Tax=Roseivirga sp. TaxID=1964215 RepID=UPI003B8C549A